MLVVLAVLAGCTSTTNIGTESTPAFATDGRPVDPLMPGRVLARPWPERVTPTGPWSATLRGTGQHVKLSLLPGRVEGGLARATFDLRSADPRPTAATPAPSHTSNLTFPDGSRWYPLAPFTVESAADLPFTSAAARAAEVTVAVGSLESALAEAGDEVTAVGVFVASDGREVDRLDLPRGTRVGQDCVGGPPCPATTEVPRITVAAQPGQVLRAEAGTQPGEAAVAGTARIEAEGHGWDGIVGALEGNPRALTATAILGAEDWSLEAETESARQAWVDVWPVADTRLEASSDRSGKSPTCLKDCSVRIRWKNVGFATSQILVAEGLGPAGVTVGFDLNKTIGHDAGIGVRRGDQRINLGGGSDIDSNLAPGEKVERGLSYAPGTEVTIVLRGNFADTSVRLAIPAG